MTAAVRLVTVRAHLQTATVITCVTSLRTAVWMQACTAVSQ